MPIRKPAVLATLLALGLLSLASSASATTFLRSDPGNVLLPNTNTVASDRGSAFLTSGIGNITCSNASLTAGTSGNPGSSVNGFIARLRFSPCSNTTPLTHYPFCESVSPLPGVSVTATATAKTIVIGPTYFRCQAAEFTNPSGACYVYAPSATGTFTNSNSSLTYTSVSTTNTVPPGTSDGLNGIVCPTTGSLTFSLADVHRTTLDLTTVTATTTATVPVTVTQTQNVTANVNVVVAATPSGTLTVTTS